MTETNDGGVCPKHGWHGVERDGCPYCVEFITVAPTPPRSGAEAPTLSPPYRTVLDLLAVIERMSELVEMHTAKRNAPLVAKCHGRRTEARQELRSYVADLEQRLQQAEARADVLDSLVKGLSATLGETDARLETALRGAKDLLPLALETALRGAKDLLPLARLGLAMLDYAREEDWDHGLSEAERLGVTAPVDGEPNTDTEATTRARAAVAGATT